MDEVVMNILRLIRIFSSVLLVFTVTFKRTQGVEHLNKGCPEEYVLQANKLCYPKVASATTHTPSYFKKLECLEGSIMVQNQCRKIICSLGEFYRGSCLYAACPQGLVWRNRMCQQPEYLTTVIEVENVLLNEINEQPIALKTPQVNEVGPHTPLATPLDSHSNTSLQPLPMTISSLQPIPSTAATTTAAPQYTRTCCKIFTPRMCKLYGSKWLCFNRRHERCNTRICSSPIVYLRPPEIKYDQQLLVLPPDPQLHACATKKRQNDTNVVDCSGCVHLHSEDCSPYCYRYICPSSICTFMDLQEYCSYYTGQTGCTSIDGCVWKWCSV